MIKVNRDTQAGVNTVNRDTQTSKNRVAQTRRASDKSVEVFAMYINDRRDEYIESIE